MAFDITSVLKGVSGPDTGKEQIEYIPVDQIDPDPNNFYSLDGLDELAGNIELIGLQQPLRVRPGDDGRFIVVSGHRRRAAILMIRDGGNEMFRDGVPCIVDRGEESPAMRELRLIYANASTRVMGPAEISKQAERTEALLYQLKEEGVVEFPGRMRDHVAEACRISKTKLARLHAIRHNLVPELLEEFDAGHLNESVAYRMSQEKPELQMELHEKAGISVRGYDINATERAFEQIKNPRPAPSAADPPSKSAEEIAAEYRESSKIEDDILRDICRRNLSAILRNIMWGHDHDFSENFRLANIDAMKKHPLSWCPSWTGNHEDLQWDSRGVRVRKLMVQDDKRSWVSFNRSWTDFYDALSGAAMEMAMKQPKPKKESAADTAAPAWNRDPEPPKEGRYLCLVDMNTRTLHEQRCDWRGGMWYAFGMPLQDLFTVVAWWPLPEEAPHPEWWSGMDDDEEEEDE